MRGGETNWGGNERKGRGYVGGGEKKKRKEKNKKEREKNVVGRYFGSCEKNK